MTLYDLKSHTNFPGGSTDAVARHVSFAQITYITMQCKSYLWISKETSEAHLQ